MKKMGHFKWLFENVCHYVYKDISEKKKEERNNERIE